MTWIFQPGKHVCESPEGTAAIMGSDPSFNAWARTNSFGPESGLADLIHQALEKSLEIDYQIESKGSPDKKKFMEIARKEGMRKAIKFRDARFSIDE